MDTDIASTSNGRERRFTGPVRQTVYDLSGVKRTDLFLGLAAAIILAGSAVRRVSAQSTTPDWEKAAGGKMSFDVASVKQNLSGLNGPVTYNVPYGSQNLFTPTGGLYSATNLPLYIYIKFAYKVTPNQEHVLIREVPKWVLSDRYDIEARASGNPTLDEYRLMMQNLLASRFDLQVHHEMRRLSVFGLVLAKRGRLGPQLRPHATDSPCSTAPAPSSTPGLGFAPTVAGGFPEPCGGLQGLKPSVVGHARLGGRNMSMDMIANSFSIQGVFGADRPIVDETGLTGTYDFVIEWTPNAKLDPNGNTFLESLKDQLGLALKSKNAAVDVVVVDRVQALSPN